MTRTELKQKCRYFAEHSKSTNAIEREQRRAFVGMYNCLNDISPITVILGDKVISKCESVISIYEESDDFDIQERVAVLKEAVAVYKEILENMVKLSE